LSSNTTDSLLAILHRVASGEVPGVALGVTNAGAAFKSLETLVAKYKLPVMLRASMSPNEIYILSKELPDA
jgi:hypothetical protein